MNNVVCHRTTYSVVWSRTTCFCNLQPTRTIAPWRNMPLLAMIISYTGACVLR
jgi:hypothetical protein